MLLLVDEATLFGFAVSINDKTVALDGVNMYNTMLHHLGWNLERVNKEHVAFSTRTSDDSRHTQPHKAQHN
jgi:hypothetical protein